MNKIICAECGGDDIQKLRWINPNTEEESSYDSFGAYDDQYCKDCMDFVEFKVLEIDENSYYEIHVFYSRNNGFSTYIMCPAEIDSDDESVISYAVSKNIIDTEDAKSVDYVESISKEDYEEWS